MSEDDLAELLDAADAADAAGADGDRAKTALALRLRNHPDLAQLADADALRAARLLNVVAEPADLVDVASLAKRAHDNGIDGAGVVFAEALDKLALFQGRPQPFGTVMVEHQGDIVQPPVDPSIDDGRRTALGVPPLRELRQRMETMGRTLARERAADRGVLPSGQRFCRVWDDPDPAVLRARLAREGASAWADGDVLTFVTESDTPVAVTPVFPMPTWDAGDGLQVLMVRVENLDEAVITYTFTPMGGGGAMRMSRGSHDGRFRGRSAPPEAPSNDPLRGTTFEHAVESTALGGPRTVTVYRPPGYEAGDGTPVIYATDGNMFAPYARRLDAAIEAGGCPPVLVVAAHAAPADHINGNQRALEYLLGFDDRRFDAHQRFFVDELPSWAEAELGASADRDRLAVFGCSDGGGHALSTGRLHPAKYGHVFAFSTGQPPEPTTSWDVDTHPAVHLCAGTLEEGFFRATEAWAGFLHLHQAPVHFTERVAGHDLIQWCEELPRAVSRAWSELG